MKPPLRISAALIALAWLMCALGCGEKGPELYPVAGELSVQGKPAPGAMVVLHPTADSAGNPLFAKSGFPRATVGEDGKFRVSTISHEDGAPPGSYSIVVTWFPPKPADRGDGDDSPGANVDRLGGRYAEPNANSPKVTVGKEATTLPKIELK